LSVSPTSRSVSRFGGTANYTVTLTRTNGFNSPVTLSVTGLPSGASATFAPNPATTTSAMIVTVPFNAARGTFTLTVQGIGGTPPLTRTATTSLTHR
jgi:hypothetical protein